MGDGPERPSNFVEFAPDRVKRFWKDADVQPVDGGWAVRLDGKTPKSPAGRGLILPREAAARMAADEWAAQREHLVSAAMPATRLAFTAIDRIGEAREAVADEIASYAGSDVICYLADGPAALAERQARSWTPWRDWAARQLGVTLSPVEGIIHRPQPPEALARVKALALELDDFALAGLAMATPLLGSAVLALAVQRGALSGAGAFALSRLDEAFTEERWGVDAEAAERTERLALEADMLERWFTALK